MKLHIFYSLILICLVSINLNAQDYQKLGIDASSIDALKALEVGSTAPNFSGKDQNGKIVELSKALENGPVVLFFYRGNWCPICQRNLAQFQDELSTALSAGVQVIAVAPEVESYRDKSVEETGVEFPVLTDPENKIMESYGVAFKVNEKYQNLVFDYKELYLTDVNGQDEAVLPVPATYLIGSNGKIKFVHYDVNYSNRATLEEVLSHL